MRWKAYERVHAEAVGNVIVVREFSRLQLVRRHPTEFVGGARRRYLEVYVYTAVHLIIVEVGDFGATYLQPIS